MVEKTKSGASITLDDYNKLKRAYLSLQDKMAAMPQLDGLTKLPNKGLYEDRLGQAMARARRSQRLMAIIVLDINHTQLITAKLGAVGKNALSCEFAARFKKSIRETDTLARIGFDRYAVLMEEVKSKKTVKSIVSKILASVDEGFHIGDNEITVTASIGVTFYDGADDTPERLVDQAERAMFKAKAQGHSAYEIGGFMSDKY